MYLNIPIENICISPDTQIKDAIAVMQDCNKQIVLVVDDSMRLLGTITDGDVRRTILKELPLNIPARKIMQVSFTACRETNTTDDILKTMRSKALRHIPILDSQGTVKDLVWITDLMTVEKANFSGVVMVGGLGTRLRPLTKDMPKPMLPVGSKPLLETVISQMREVGISKVSLTTHYKPEIIRNHFGDGDKFGVDISYVHENQPLGTAGALGLMDPPPEEPILVINGDVLTKLNFKAMFEFHKDHHADMTVGVRRHKMTFPYGVIECSNEIVRSLKEKPVLSFLINAGIYILEPHTFKIIPENVTHHMTDMIQLLLDKGYKVISFPIHEYWIDVGQHADYERANIDFSGIFKE